MNQVPIYHYFQFIWGKYGNCLGGILYEIPAKKISDSETPGNNFFWQKWDELHWILESSQQIEGKEFFLRLFSIVFVQIIACRYIFKPDKWLKWLKERTGNTFAIIKCQNIKFLDFLYLFFVFILLTDAQGVT